MSPSLIVLAAGFLAVGEWESRARWRALKQREEQRWLGNSALMFLGLGLTWSVSRMAPVALAALAAANPFGLLNRSWMPAPIAWILAVVLLDLARYIMHVAHHRIPVLWRLHRVHHADTELDVSTGFRVHPLNSPIILAWHLAAVALLAPPPGAVVLAECLFAFQSLFTHANARLPEWVDARARRLLVTPAMHRIHHSTRETEQMGNFGDVLTWWDVLFGTYIAAPEGGEGALVHGLRGIEAKESLHLWSMLTLPLRSEADLERVGEARTPRENP